MQDCDFQTFSGNTLSLVCHKTRPEDALSFVAATVPQRWDDYCRHGVGVAHDVEVRRRPRPGGGSRSLALSQPAAHRPPTLPATSSHGRRRVHLSGPRQSCEIGGSTGARRRIIRLHCWYGVGVGDGATVCCCSILGLTVIPFSKRGRST